jgi:hypothetical protein
MLSIERCDLRPNPRANSRCGKNRVDKEGGPTSGPVVAYIAPEHVDFGIVLVSKPAVLYVIRHACNVEPGSTVNRLVSHLNASPDRVRTWKQLSGQ